MRAGCLGAGLFAGLVLSLAGRVQAGGISGQITDASSGAPLAGISVRINSGPTAFVESVVSDAGGFWQSSSNLPSGTYRLRTSNSVGHLNERYDNLPCVGNCSLAGETLVTVTDPATTTGINFALSQGGSISGTTLNDSTGLSADAFLNVYNSVGTFLTQARTRSDGTGGYQTEGLPPGTYYVLATSLSGYVSELYNNSPCVQGCPVTSGTPVTIVGTTPTTGVDFSLTAGGFISGTVTSASSGATLSGVSVKVHDSSGTLMATAVSGATGWSLPSNGGALRPGSYYLVTSNAMGYGDERYDNQPCASSCDPLVGTAITVTAGLTASGRNFALTPASQVAINAGNNQTATAGSAVATAPSVIVRDASNSPVAGVQVTFAVATGGGSITGATGITDASGIAAVGSWTLGNKAGPNTLTATLPGASGSTLTFAATGVAGLATQMAATQVWTTGGPLGTALANAIAIDPVTPSTLYVGTENAGVFKSTNAGATWSQASNGGLADLRVFSIAIDPSTPSTLYAGTDQGVFKSTDAGGVWTPASTGLTSTIIRAIVMDPATPSRLYAMTSSTGGLFKSNDAGATWAAWNTGLTTETIRALAIDPTNSSILYAATSGGGMFKSIDAGGAWVATNNGVTAGVISTITIDPTTPATIYAGGTSRLLKSVDSGATWAVVLASTVNQIVVDASSPSIVYAATLVGVYKSINSGAAWSPVNAGLTTSLVQGLASMPGAPSTLFAATYGMSGVFKTIDSGASWVTASVGLDAAVVNGMAIHPGTPATVYAASQTGAFKSIDSALTWTRASNGMNAALQAKAIVIDPVSPSTLYAGMIALGGGVFTSVVKSTDAGANWTGANTGMATTGANVLVIHPTTPSTLFAGSAFGGVFGSTNSAGSWFASSTGLTNLNVNSVVIDATSPTTLYAGTNGGVFKSTNSAANWTAVNSGLTNLAVRALAVHPLISSTLFAGTANGLFKSLDSGATWIASSTGLTSTAISALAIHPTNPSIVYAGTDTDGVFVSLDSGASWSALNGGLEIAKVRTLLIEPSGANLYAGVHAVWKIPTAGVGDSQTAMVGTAVAIRPSVIVRDSNGNPVPGVSVTFAVTSGGGGVTGDTQTTNAMGIATVGSWVIGPTPGTDNNTLSASAGALAGSPIVFTASGTGATQIAIHAGNNQSAPAGSAVAINPSVIVKDGSGNPVAGVSVTFQIGSGGGSLPFAATSVVTGYGHTCALTTAGGVKCWGSNAYGQLGDGTMTTRLSPVDVQGLSSGVASLSVGGGGNHSCAVTTGGALKCWGRNTNGQVGDGTTIDRLIPADVLGLSTGVSKVAASNFHTCALMTAGGVKCWGAGGTGALGDGTTNNRTSPVDVSGLSSGVSSIAAGLSTSCAVTTTGGAKCWGNNGNGQLGDGTNTARWAPVDVSSLTSGVSAVAAGDFFTCALTTAGGVKCWGANSAGRLGHGAGPDTNLPEDVTGLTSGVSRVATGVAHACVVTAAGAAKCWGIGGALGDGTTASRTTPVDVVGLTDVSGVSAAWLHTCAVTETGRVKCFGSNNNGGVLGDGTTTSRLTPANVAGLSNVTRITDGSGIAGVEWMLGPMTGTGNNSLIATSATLSGSPVTFTASAAASFATQASIGLGNGQSATVGTAVAIAPAVRVFDGYGNPVPGVGVTFAVATGGGSVMGAAQTTNASGFATVGSWTLGTTAGASNNTLTASVAGLSAIPVTFTASATAGAATQIAINAGNNQTATAGSAVGTPPSVIVRDANNNPKSGVSVTFAIATGGGSLTGGAQTTNASGIATLGSWTLGTIAGTSNNSLTVTSAGLSGSPLSFAASATAGPATQIAINAGNNQTATAGAAVSTAPSVVVRDANNNPVSGVPVTFAVAGGGGSLTGGTPTTNAAGIATVGSWTLGPAAGSHTLSATSTGLSGSPITFTTTAVSPPTMADPSSSGIDTTTAVLGANVQTDGGSAITARGFVYSITSVNPNPILGGAGVTTLVIPGTTGPLSASPTSLLPGTTYSFKAFATNPIGTGYTPVATFTTLALPGAITGTATNVTLSSAILAGVVNPHGSVTSAVFDYGVTLAYGHQAAAGPAPGSGSSDVGVTASATGLSCGTTYHFRLVATSSTGTTNGSDATFTTTACQGLSINDPSIAEGGAGTSIIAFTISLPEPSTSDVSVDYATADGTASGGADFTAATGTFIIPAGTTSKQLALLVTGDTTFEPDESFTLILSNALGATLAKTQGTATIVNDDPPGPATLVTQYRLYHDGTKEHLYTTDLNEYTVLGARGWTQEGVAYNMLTNGIYNGVMATIPFFRLYHPGILQHHWTTDSNEARVLASSTSWFYEGTIGYLLPTQAPGSVPLYRMSLASPPIHVWTVDKNEYDTLATWGWTPEGVVGYVIP